MKLRCELDDQVASRVMGVRFALSPRYSTSISEAWSVVARLRELYPDGWVSILVGVGDGWHVGVSTGDRECSADGKTAPQAICRAALMAVDS